MTKLIGLVVAILAACAVPLLGAAAIFGGGGGASCVPAATTPGSPGSAAPGPGLLPPIDGFDTEQVSHVATIVTVGNTRGVPPWGWVVAVATAIQESGLRNLPGGDRDSIGLFQQRPSQGWGTPRQLTDPAYQAGRFFDRLLTVEGWAQMPLTDAAQQVQQSAYPDAFGKHTTTAVRLVNHVGSGIWRATPENLAQCVSTCPTASGSSSVPSGPAISCSGGEAVLVRAATWLTAWHGGPVPYLSSGDPNTWFGGYRRDCSGYASMALGLAGPGLTTAGLAARATPVPKTALRAGDLLINPAPDLAGHVAVFDQWTDTAMTSYLGYEQSGDGGTHHRVIPYPYFDGYPMSPYRWLN